MCVNRMGERMWGEGEWSGRRVELRWGGSKYRGAGGCLEVRVVRAGGSGDFWTGGRG